MFADSLAAVLIDRAGRGGSAWSLQLGVLQCAAPKCP